MKSVFGKFNPKYNMLFEFADMFPFKFVWHHAGTFSG